MGREATCSVMWAGEQGMCKVQLEPPDLIVRGAIRRKAPVSALRQIAVQGDALHFQVSGESVELALGGVQAERWAKALMAPPPSLAAKLAITASTRLLVLGEIADSALEEAIGQAKKGTVSNADLILAVVEDADALGRTAQQLTGRAAMLPVWIVYPKGRGKAIGETQIRETMRDLGWIDVKVASVSSALTALRFVQRK